MSYIMEGVYVGDSDDALDTINLREKKGISHILTVERRPLPLELTQDFIYKYVHALDVEDFDLLSHLGDCLKFIEEGRLAGGVLIHCWAGQSRSGMVVTAYVMKCLNLTLPEALIMVRKLRPVINPNEGFMRQLELYEQMGCEIDFGNQILRRYRLELLSRQRVSALMETIAVPAAVMCDDPTRSAITEAVYKCQKCRRALFRASTVMFHEEGPGERAFKGQLRLQKTYPSKSSSAALSPTPSDTSLCGASLFIEPVEWMQSDILALKGKLCCPNLKCSAKLGTFDWAGDRCSCGSWVTPAFHMHKSKLDFCSIRPTRPININHSSLNVSVISQE